MTKKIISVDVGDPVLRTHKSSYSGEWTSIEITNRETVYTETDIDSLIRNLQELRDQYCNDYENMILVAREDCGCYGECSCSPTLYLHGKRRESDVEYLHRLDKEAQEQRKRDERDRAEFERLSKKFDK